MLGVLPLQSLISFFFSKYLCATNVCCVQKEDYLNIIKSYSNYYKIKLEKNDLQNSIQWSLQRGNRNGRTAWQFIIQLASEKNLKISF